MTDGAIDNTFEDAVQPTLRVGDHVSDREDDDGAPMLVAELPGERASDFDAGDKTVAEYNPDYPADDWVVQVVYPQRTDTTLEGAQRYGFPRSRLELVAPIHDEGGCEDDDDLDDEDNEMYRSYCTDCDFSMKWASKDDAEAAANNHSTVNPHNAFTEVVDDD